MALSSLEAMMISAVSLILTGVAVAGCAFLLLTRCVSMMSAACCNGMGGNRNSNGSSISSSSGGSRSGGVGGLTSSDKSMLPFCMSSWSWLSSALSISRIPLFLIVCDTSFAILSCYYSPVISAKEVSSTSNNCEVSGPLTQFFSISAFIWATAITSTSFKVINYTLGDGLGSGFSRRGSLSISSSQQSRRNSINSVAGGNDRSPQPDDHNLITKSYLLMAFIIPIVSALVMVAISESNSGDYNRVSCWLSFKSGKNELIKYYFFVSFVYIIPLLVMEVYCLKILYSMWKMFHGSPYRHSSITKLFIYLIIIIGTKGLLLLSRIVMISRANSDYTFSEVLFMAIVYPLQGLGDILIFIINESDSGVVSSWFGTNPSSSKNSSRNDSPITIYSSAANGDMEHLDVDNNQSNNRSNSCTGNLELLVDSFSGGDSKLRRGNNNKSIQKLQSSSSMYSTLSSSSYSGHGDDDDDADADVDVDMDDEEEIDFGTHRDLDKLERSSTLPRLSPTMNSSNRGHNAIKFDKNNVDSASSDMENKVNETTLNPMFL